MPFFSRSAISRLVAQKLASAYGESNTRRDAWADGSSPDDAGCVIEERFDYECPEHGIVTSLTWAESLRDQAPMSCPTCETELAMVFVSSDKRELLR